MEERLQEFFSEFRRSLLVSPNKSQHGESSNLRGSRSEKYDQGQNTRYPCMRVEFPRWEDGDPTSWVSRAEKFFHFYITLEESKVEVASNQLDDDAIRCYDLHETYHGVPSWRQFKRELQIRFGPSEYKNVNR
ncbi:hypothetical protein B296_00054365 [Ensete ventricosum]|uniref:Retrotransposon gag domain-containing protein n=1 Tax=Ensete ventricosum TaxID=4639 RepID=A0A426X2L3_ENSVE|nr:hypothetical protein B296_00054365 [Ensete ventricosum]